MRAYRAGSASTDAGAVTRCVKVVSLADSTSSRLANGEEEGTMTWLLMCRIAEGVVWRGFLLRVAASRDGQQENENKQVGIERTRHKALSFAKSKCKARQAIH